MAPTSSEVEILRTELATLQQLLEVHEEQAAKQFGLINKQQQALEERAREMSLANERLEALSDFLEEIYRTMPGGLLILDRKGVVEAVNDEVQNLLGYSEPEIVGRTVALLFDPADVPDVAEIEAHAESHGVFRAEKSCRTRAGETVPVLFSATMYGKNEAARQPRGFVCVTLDLRERRKLEVELRQAQKLESVGRLAAGVAHEINTPVQFVGDSLRFVRDAMADLAVLVESYQALHQAAVAGLPLEGPANEVLKSEQAADLPYLRENVPVALDRALEGLNRVATIVKSLKDFAHPDKKEMTSVDLNKAIQSTLVIAAHEYEQVASVDTDLGELPLVTCHASEINQVILNLLVNAAHAIGEVVRKTDGQGRIRITTRREGEEAVVSIADSGAGIPTEIRDRIYDPFFTTKEVGKGSGQGLTITRSVLEKHGGAISFETEAGKGTTFVIRLPIDPCRKNRTALAP